MKTKTKIFIASAMCLVLIFPFLSIRGTFANKAVAAVVGGYATEAQISTNSADSPQLVSMPLKNVDGKNIFMDPSTGDYVISEAGQARFEPTISIPDEHITYIGSEPRGPNDLYIHNQRDNAAPAADTEFRDAVSALIGETMSGEEFGAIVITAGEAQIIKDGEPEPAVEGKTVTPTTEAGVLMVPLSLLVDNAEAEMSYKKDGEGENETVTAVITTPDGEISLTAGDGTMTVNGTEVKLPAETSVVEGEILVPISDMAEAVGLEVDGSADQATIYRPYQLKRIVVKTESGGNIDDLGALEHLANDDGKHILQYETEAQAREAHLYYENSPDVVYAEPDIIVSAEYNSWGVEAIAAPEYQEWLAENVLGGLPKVVVGVLDTGIDLSHPFLSGRVIPNNYNYLTGAGSSFDGHSHGTHVSGIIVDASPQNVMVQPYKVLSDKGVSAGEGINAAIEDAIANGVDVINMSFGGSVVSKSLEESIQKAVRNNICVVVSAGNDASNAMYYSPARISEAITVVALSKDKQRWASSNYGECIDLSAPGAGVLSCIPNNRYAEYDGTSMAAPHVSAAAALLKSYNKNISPADIKATLKDAAEDLGEPGWDQYYGSGMVNLRGLALSASVPENPVFSQPSGEYAEPFYLEITCESPGVLIYYTLDGSTPTESSNLYTGPIYIDGSAKVNACAYNSGHVPSTLVPALYNVSAFPASVHNLDFDYDWYEWVYTAPAGTKAMKITFDPRSDFIDNLYEMYAHARGLYIKDGNDEYVANSYMRTSQYSAGDLAGNSVYIQGDHFSIQYNVQQKALQYGFAITEIAFYMDGLPETPRFSPEQGSYYASWQTVQISAPEDTRIFYTTDGTVPTQASTPYPTNGIVLAEPTLIKATAFRGDGLSSYTAIGAFLVSEYPESLHNIGYAALDGITAGPGIESHIYYEYPGEADYLKITFSENSDLGHDGAEIGPRFDSPAAQSIVFGETGNAIVWIGSQNSYIHNDAEDTHAFIADQLSGRTMIVPGKSLNIYTTGWITPQTYGFKIDNVEPLIGTRASRPVFSLEPGYYSEQRPIAINAGAGAAIYYTTDGSLPSEKSSRYSGEPLTFKNLADLKAVAFEAGKVQSEVAIGSYIFSKYPETKHIQPYKEYNYNNCHMAYEYPDSTVEALELRFNERSDATSLVVKGANGEVVYSGPETSGGETDLLGKVIRVPGNRFTIEQGYLGFVIGAGEFDRFNSYGFKVDSIMPVGGALSVEPAFGAQGDGNWPSIVTLKHDAANYSEVYFTLDGSEPRKGAAQLYTEPFSLFESKILKAVAYNASTGQYSPTLEGAYYFRPIGSLHNQAGWHDLTWSLSEVISDIVFDSRSQIDDILVFNVRPETGLGHARLPISLERNDLGEYFVPIRGTQYVNIQYIGGFTEQEGFGFKEKSDDPVETPTVTFVATPTSTPEPTSTFTLEPTPTSTPEPTPTFTSEPTPTSTPEPTSASALEPTPTFTPEPTSIFTMLPIPTVAPSVTATDAPVIPPSSTLFIDTPADIELSAGQYAVYKFTPSSNGMYSFFTGPFNGNGYANDTVLELFSNPALTDIIASNDDYEGSVFSRISTELSGGADYYLRIRNYHVSIRLRARLAVEIDAQGQSLTPTPTMPLDTFGFIEPGMPVDIDLPAGQTSVYQFIPETSGEYVIHSDPIYGNGPTNDTVLELYSDSGLTNIIASNDDYNGSVFSQISLQLNGGEAYYIKLRNYHNNVRLRARLEVESSINS